MDLSSQCGDGSLNSVRWCSLTPCGRENTRPLIPIEAKCERPRTTSNSVRVSTGRATGGLPAFVRPDESRRLKAAVSRALGFTRYRCGADRWIGFREQWGISPSTASRERTAHTRRGCGSRYRMVSPQPVGACAVRAVRRRTQCPDRRVGTPPMMPAASVRAPALSASTSRSRRRCSNPARRPRQSTPRVDRYSQIAVQPTTTASRPGSSAAR